MARVRSAFIGYWGVRSKQRRRRRGSWRGEPRRRLELGRLRRHEPRGNRRCGWAQRWGGRSLRGMPGLRWQWLWRARGERVARGQRRILRSRGSGHHDSGSRLFRSWWRGLRRSHLWSEPILSRRLQWRGMAERGGGEPTLARRADLRGPPRGLQRCAHVQLCLRLHELVLHARCSGDSVRLRVTHSLTKTEQRFEISLLDPRAAETLKVEAVK